MQNDVCPLVSRVDLYIFLIPTVPWLKQIKRNAEVYNIEYNTHVQSILPTAVTRNKAGLRLQTYTTKLANSPITDAPDDIFV